jgi:hypothetical protein
MTTGVKRLLETPMAMLRTWLVSAAQRHAPVSKNIPPASSPMTFENLMKVPSRCVCGCFELALQARFIKDDPSAYLADPDEGRGGLLRVLETNGETIPAHLTIEDVWLIRGGQVWSRDLRSVAPVVEFPHSLLKPLSGAPERFAASKVRVVARLRDRMLRADYLVSTEVVTDVLC